MAILEEVFRSALKRKFGSDENFDIIINPDKGDLEIWRNRIVVENDEVEDDNEEISLDEAQKIEPDFEVGEEVSEEVKLIDLGRRAILALRQNLISKIHEHDNTNIFKHYKELEGELYSVQKFIMSGIMQLFYLMIMVMNLFYLKVSRLDQTFLEKENL